MKKQQINISLENLIRRTEAFKNGIEFKKFLDFTAKFKRYKPYNNMLVYIQNPDCSFYATEKHYRENFKRFLKENARPMIILAPMHPVLFVYDVNDTEGDELPKMLNEDPFNVEGNFSDKWLENLISYFSDFKISLRKLKMHSNKAGHIARKSSGIGFEIVINSNHEAAVQLSTLVHELAHLMLGHLGSNDDENFPVRKDLKIKTEEIEAEAIAYLVLQRIGLENNSHRYLAFYDAGFQDLSKISADLIMKISGKIEKMIFKPNKKKEPTNS